MTNKNNAFDLSANPMVKALTDITTAYGKAVTDNFLQSVEAGNKLAKLVPGGTGYAAAAVAIAADLHSKSVDRIVTAHQDAVALATDQVRFVAEQADAMRAQFAPA